MIALGEALLYAISARGDLGWPAFSRAFDELYVTGPLPTPGDEAIRHLRRRAAQALDALGHCDIDFSETPGRVIAAPPLLATLPIPGLPQAVLCGSRSPATSSEMGVACTEPSGVDMKIGPQHALVPRRILVTGSSVDALDQLARKLSIRFARVPPAYSIGACAGGLDAYMARLNWREDAEPTWPRQDFDPYSLRFSGERIEGHPLRLVSYQNPTTLRRVHWLWREGACADVDRNWGRYAVLHATGSHVLSYDPATGSVGVPRSAPLPRLHARALALCSGMAPALVGTDALPAATPDPIGLDVYRGVPPDLMEATGLKVGQVMQAVKVGNERDHTT